MSEYAAGYAPVLIVAYNRPGLFRETLHSLSENALSSCTDLYIAIDGGKNQSDLESGDLIESLSGSYEHKFKSLEVVRRESNLGLAENIRKSVDYVINRHGRIIVLEDDIVSSLNFLEFMNDALDYYRSVPEVWHISSHTVVNDEQLDTETFLWRVMNCWGWGTWQDRWQWYEKDVDHLMHCFDRGMIKRFNLDGVENFWSQVRKNYEGRINTWAVFWYATIFLHHGLCLNPRLSFTKNIGFDGSGVHCARDNEYSDQQIVNDFGGFSPAHHFQEDEAVVQEIKEFYRRRKGFLDRLMTRFSHYF